MPHKRKTHKMQFKTVPSHLHAAPNVCVKSNHGSEMENTLSPQRPALREVPSSSTGNHFAVPQCNTTLRKHEELNALQNIRAVVGPDLTPRSKAVIAPKVEATNNKIQQIGNNKQLTIILQVTLKMNFPANVAVFDNLEPLNVNDSLTTWEHVAKTSKPISKTDQPEPILNQYVQKIEPIVRILPELDLQLEFPCEDFNFLKAYKKVYKWK
ncbi:hypothetical protein KR044_006506 [Drosophila immigrans]|nr:hypothetical protein KR044_006506 [Drosophila immigrans]